jgi:hypothetical protein
MAEEDRLTPAIDRKRTRARPRRQEGGAAQAAQPPGASDKTGAHASSAPAESDVPLCLQCSTTWGTRRPNKAAWLLFLVSGVAELSCNRHADMALTRGAWALPLSELPGLRWTTRVRPDYATVINRARPEPEKPLPSSTPRVRPRDDRLAYSLGMRLLELVDEAASGGSG